ncbi:protease modulator HflC [Ferruginivarius sediminum]|uniref:Protein HflC n=1 Tax=Ferruginivarius sediminum TaxID=2661937 RepID=A0A369TI25_9PROT|nr:protease modulator HflC [Ferruginivarius sediminum]RDD62536.1 protease modulator HflC [Ferruginivarius sediminum]
MNRKLPLIIGVAVVVLGIVGSSALFTVPQTQQAIVMQFGEPKRVIPEPGLNVKLPFVQNVLYYEKRVLDLDPPVERVLLADQKPLNVDSFARYRITDPLRFYQRVRFESNLRDRLGSIINSNLRSVLGNVNLASILSDERADIMNRIQTQVNREAQNFGIDIVDVRIGRTDLPQEVSQAVYSRMRSEREREAAEFRAQGQEEAQRIRATADREATVIRAEAQREAEIISGTGEAARTTTLNQAFGQDEDFFRFYRSMQAYEGSINQGDTDNSYIVLSTDRNEFFRMLGRGAITEELSDAIESSPSGGGQAASQPADGTGSNSAGTAAEAAPAD